MDWPAHLGRIHARIGEDVTVKPASGAASYTARGMFLASYTELLGSALPGIAATQPRFATMSSDVPDLAIGDTIVRGTAAIEYRVATLEPDDPAGEIVMQLELKD